MKKSRLVDLLVVALFVALAGCNGNDYNGVMTKKIRAALGDDFKDYITFSYPTSNYGLITAYESLGGNSAPKNEDFICDMWNCIGLPDTQVPDSNAAQLSMNDFASVGRNGAVISLSDTEQRELSLKAALPEIYGVLKVGGSVSDKNVTTVDMKLGQAWPRLLRKQKMLDYISSLGNTTLLKKSFQQGTLILIVGDVVIESMKITVTVDASGAEAIDAALGPGPLPVGGKIFKDASVEVKASQTAKGTYTFEIVRPVVVMRLAKRQPGAGVLGVTDDWSDWPSVSSFGEMKPN